MVAGRLNLPALTNLLGRNSFGTDITWMELLSYPNNTLANNLHTYWTRLQTEYQQAVDHREEETAQLITHEVNKAGADETGKVPNSITWGLTIKQEEGRSDMLGKRFSLWPSNAQENLAQQNVDLISSQFQTTLPDNAGFIPDDEF
eukprot:9053263-Ditylum_brightwellii.AAC.1